MTRLFTGDYATGDFSQWTRLANKSYAVNGVYHPARGAYPAAITTDDPECGYCARFEVRDGDVPVGGGSDRSEVFGDDSVYAAAGTTRWYALSVKFDPTFPTNRSSLSWGSIAQWKGASVSPYVEYGSPVLNFGWSLIDAPGYRSGYWYLVWNPQSEPGVGVNAYARPIVEIPLDLGQWHDIKMRVYWMKNDTGTIQIWRNGEQLSFDSTYGGGGTTFTGQTVCGGTGPAGVTFHQGIYRDSAITQTEIVYLRGFRMADSEASL